jgi:hypothetical protein
MHRVSIVVHSVVLIRHAMASGEGMTSYYMHYEAFEVAVLSRGSLQV